MVHVVAAVRCMCFQPMGGGGLVFGWRLGRGSTMGNVFAADIAHGGSASCPFGSIPFSSRLVVVPRDRLTAVVAFIVLFVLHSMVSFFFETIFHIADCSIFPGYLNGGYVGLQLLMRHGNALNV